MPTSFEFCYDFISPYSYLAATQVEDLARRTDAHLIYRPVFLGGLFKETGNRPPLEVASKASYLPKDIADWARHYNVPVTYPPTFPFNSIKAMRGALIAEKEGKLAEYTQLGFKACWGEGKDLGDPVEVGKLAQAAGLDGEKLLAATEEPAVKELLKERTSDAVGRGAFGVPTFFVEGEMFWGNDRLVLLEERLKRAG